MLYVVDSVTRKWMDQAKQQGQAINSSAQDGTFAAGVNRVTELMPVLMNDITATAPADQKVRSHICKPPTTGFAMHSQHMRTNDSQVSHETFIEGGSVDLFFESQQKVALKHL